MIRNIKLSPGFSPKVGRVHHTRISTSIRQANVPPVRNVNFSISVDAVVPASVRFYPVTPAIVEVYPEYSGYQFVVVEEEIVIVEPRSRKIVTVIDTGGSGRAASRAGQVVPHREAAEGRPTRRHTTPHDRQCQHDHDRA
jgi:hypothetical protein